MVGHEGVGVERTLLLLQRLAQPVQVGAVVFFVKKARLAIMPSLHDVQRNSIHMNARATGHARMLTQN